jgi:energy-coupling factor transporter transmembrane protein EcfT
MIKFLQCEVFTFLKLIVLLLIVYLITKIAGSDKYTNIIVIGSLISIILFGLFFIWKLFMFLFKNENNSEYQCSQNDTLRRAMTWVSNIV